MITYVYGDLFTSPARVLVNTVNTVGTMGAGLAKDFKRYYPQMFTAYKDLCERDQLDVGQLMLYRTLHKWLLNFPTKKHFRANSKPEYIEVGLQKFATIFSAQDITSASFPQLGTGNLDWQTQVKPLMEAYLEPLPIPIYVHIHQPDAPDAQRPTISTRTMRDWLHGQPLNETFDAFYDALVQATQRKRQFIAWDSAGTTFEVHAQPRSGRGRVSMKLNPGRGKSLYLSQSMLLDLWHYLRRAGYVLPQNLPAGLDAHAAYALALLAELDTMQQVSLALVGGDVVRGLQYVPPVRRDH